jgi:uncharacterized protein
MIKAVLDVGQFVSATIKPKGHPGQILTLWREEAFDLYTSLPILDDLRRVLFYKHIRRRHHLPDEEIHVFVDSLIGPARMTPGKYRVKAVKADPTDDKILACAHAGKVDYIVSSDEHLTSLGEF